MTDKSYVSLEQNVCIVCGASYDTGSLLLDKRLRATLEHHTLTGYGLCPEHQKLFDDGFVALVECSNDNPTDSLKMREANRTGRIAHLRRTVANDIFDVDIGDGPMIYVEAGKNGKKGVIDELEDMVEKS